MCVKFFLKLRIGANDLDEQKKPLGVNIPKGYLTATCIGIGVLFLIGFYSSQTSASLPFAPLGLPWASGESAPEYGQAPDEQSLVEKQAKQDKTTLENFEKKALDARKLEPEDCRLLRALLFRAVDPDVRNRAGFLLFMYDRQYVIDVITQWELGTIDDYADFAKRYFIARGIVITAAEAIMHNSSMIRQRRDLLNHNSALQEISDYMVARVVTKGSPKFKSLVDCLLKLESAISLEESPTIQVMLRCFELEMRLHIGYYALMMRASDDTVEYAIAEYLEKIAKKVDPFLSPPK
jgi:hypothetical protein